MLIEYISESEKYAHITYFFNGGYAKKVNGESYYMVKSPDVKFYNETPRMKSDELMNVIIANLKNNNINNYKYDFTVLNFASPDMIGHTGDLQAGIECCEAIDKNIEKIVKAYLKLNGTVLITADHGNIEEMINLETDEIDTEHSSNLVPFIVVNEKLRKKIKLKKQGVLGDIAPTILKILNKKKLEDMTGKSLIIGHDSLVE